MIDKGKLPTLSQAPVRELASMAALGIALSLAREHRPTAIVDRALAQDPVP